MSIWTPGPNDRITRDGTPPVDPHVLDEIVLTGVTVHLERMDEKHYYLGIYDGLDNVLQVSIDVPTGGKRRRCEAYVYYREGFAGTTDDYQER